MIQDVKDQKQQNFNESVSKKRIVFSTT